MQARNFLTLRALIKKLNLEKYAAISPLHFVYILML
jgi:hypothetical protein